jgi:hypothetical protein
MMPVHHDKVTPLVDRLAEASTLADALLRELRSELKEARKVLREVQAERVQVEAMVRRAVADEIREAVRDEVGKLGEATRKAVNEAHDHAIAEFGKLTNMAMYGNEQGRGENVFDIVRQRGDVFREILRDHEEGT